MKGKFGGPKAYNFQLRDVVPAAAYDYVCRASTPRDFGLMAARAARQFPGEAEVDYAGCKRESCAFS